MDQEWLKNDINFSFKLNELEVEKHEYSREEALTLLALFELSGGTSEVGIESDKIQGKVDSYLETLNQGRNLEELVDSVKRQVHPRN